MHRYKLKLLLGGIHRSYMLPKRTNVKPNVCGGELNSKSIVRFSKRNVMLVADFFSKVSKTTTRQT
jgi:hypothetical protein